MGILVTDEQAYYATGGSHGNYRYISLTEILDSFRATYVGHDKICEKAVDGDITFHAIRALQELSYDTLKSTKDWEIEVPATLVMVMPADYVNYVKLSWSGDGGIERIIYPISKTSNPRDITETVQDWGGFTITGGANIDLASDEESDTWDNYKSSGGSTSTAHLHGGTSHRHYDEHSHGSSGDQVNTRYGLDPQHAHTNGSFFIDEDAGKFHFSSNLSGKTLILRYISDGIATNTANSALDLDNCLVPKLAEEAIYKWILFGLLLARKDTNGGLLAEIKKQKYAETRKAKLRLSNIKIEEITQTLRGGSKIIKH